MAVTEGTLPVGDTGKNLDTTVVEQTDGTEAHREAVILTDPEDNDARAKITDEASRQNYGLVVHDPQSAYILAAIQALGNELRVIREHLNIITEYEDD